MRKSSTWVLLVIAVIVEGFTVHHVGDGRKVGAIRHQSLNAIDEKASSSSKQAKFTTSSKDVIDALTRGKEEFVAVASRPITAESSTQTTTTTLDLGLEIGGIDIDENDENDPILMGINHLIVELCSDALSSDSSSNESVKLPGADSKHQLKSKYSTGHLHLNVLQKGSFVTLDGTQYVDANRGCWEIHWMKDKPAGQLVIGFDIPKTYRRNKYNQQQSCLSKGTIYISFPIWSKHGLLYAQNEKLRVEEELQQLSDDYENAMYHLHNEESEDFNNPIMKLVHMHNAHVAQEKYCHHVDNTPLLDCIPDPAGNDKMIELQSMVQNNDEEDENDDSFLLSSRGMIYHQEQHQQHRLIGFCNAACKRATTETTSRLESTERRSRLMP